MKAVVVSQAGGLEALSYTDISDPEPKNNELVLKVHSCGVCFHDVLTRNGTLKAGVSLPCVLGHEVSGTVIELGPQAKGFKVGDRVATTQRSHICGHCRFCRSGYEPLCAQRVFLGDVGLVGGYAQYLAISSDCIAQVPEGVDLDHAAVAACAVGTVLNAVRDVGRVQMGETVLITGAGGGLGLHAIQLARLAGAQVLAQTTSADKVESIRKMGAHEVVLHARGEPFFPFVRDLTHGQGVDVIIDNVGTVLFEDMRKSLAIQGRWLMIGQLTGDFVPFNPAQFFLKNQSLLSVTSTSRKQLEDVLTLMQRGHITPVIERKLPLSAVAEAHQAVEAGRTSGRWLLSPGGLVTNQGPAKLVKTSKREG
jgi:D-arabinose 1-dehydrogenase-like Zn-dependent alcohol dehydrogenase